MFLKLIFLLSLLVVGIFGDCLKVSIKEREFSSDFKDVQWFGSDSRSVIVLLNDGSVYTSHDEGKNMLADTLTSTDIIQGMKISPANKDTVYMWSKTQLYYSKDAGRSFENNSLPDNPADHISNILPHSTNQESVLVLTSSPRCSSWSNGGNCFFTLWGSTYHGKNLLNITNYVYQYSWGADHNVWVTETPDKTGNYWSHSSYQLNLVKYSITTQVSAPTIFRQQVAGLLLVDNILFFAEVKIFKFLSKFSINASKKYSVLKNQQTNRQLRLYSAADYGEEPFVQAKFSSDDLLDEKRYTILDISYSLNETDRLTFDRYPEALDSVSMFDGSVYISVQVGSDTSKGNIYQSDSLRSEFVESISNVVRRSSGHVDWTKSYGLDGIYFTNQVNQLNQVETKFTIDNGGLWKRPYDEETSQFLNFHGEHKTSHHYECNLFLDSVSSFFGLMKTSEKRASTLFGPLYSRTDGTAKGLIMASGNTGSTLSTIKADTYFTRTAGLDWDLVKNGSFVYEFADHGALTVMIEKNLDTNQYDFSWNEGLNWNTCDLSLVNKFTVDDILSDPDSVALSFIVLGKSSSSGKSIFINIDFSGYHERICTLDDYESWSPTDEKTGPACILGQTITYSRRKRAAECFNDKEKVEQVSIKPCDCTRDDYECDFLYYLDSDNTTCKQLVPTHVGLPNPCNPGQVYSVSRGYRKVAGDVCEGGASSTLGPEGLVCPPASVCGGTTCFPGVSCDSGVCGNCPRGYTGNGITCSNLDECTATSCFPDVTCTDIPAPGTGFLCGDCPTGYEGDGKTCSDVDGCAINPCYLGVTCTDVKAPGTGATCGSCPTGYAGDGRTCTDADECKEDSCFNGVYCIDNVAPATGFTCGPCPNGYEGDGKTCTKIIVCADNPCFTGVTCTDNTGSGVTCGSCPSGYEGDGKTCTDVDGCKDSPCYPGVTCSDQKAPGTGATCGACPTGYTGDGKTCSDVDGCAINPCYLGVTCTDVKAPGTGATCGVCPTGYKGDGKTCTKIPNSSVAGASNSEPGSGSGAGVAIAIIISILILIIIAVVVVLKLQKPEPIFNILQPFAQKFGVGSEQKYSKVGMDDPQDIENF